MNSVPQDPFFRKLYSKLAEELDDRVNSLARGSALVIGDRIGVDAINTAMNYQKAVSYIEALQSVIELGCQMDRDMYGIRKNQTDGED